MLDPGWEQAEAAMCCQIARSDRSETGTRIQDWFGASAEPMSVGVNSLVRHRDAIRDCVAAIALGQCSTES